MKNASELLFGMLVAAVVVACSKPADERTHADAGVPLQVDSARCASCHQPEFRGAKRPPHVDVRPLACGVCHTQTEWGKSRIDHPGWALTGAHARAAADDKPAGKESQVKCFWCHRGDVTTFKTTKKDCVSCHAEDREKQNAISPDHEDFPKTCETCHSTETWKHAKMPASLLADAGALGAGVSDAAAEPVDAGQVTDAGASDAGAPKPRPKPPPPKPPKPPKPPRPPPDVISHPSGR